MSPSAGRADHVGAAAQSHPRLPLCLVTVDAEVRGLLCALLR